MSNSSTGDFKLKAMNFGTSYPGSTSPIIHECLECKNNPVRFYIFGFLELLITIKKCEKCGFDSEDEVNKNEFERLEFVKNVMET